MVVPSATPNINFLKPCATSKLVTYNVRTLMQIEQQLGSVRALESLAIVLYCISETHTQNPSEVLRLSPPSEGSNSMYHLRLSGDPVVSGSGVAGVGDALNVRDEAALLD
ncbi:unnamed protein product [Trichobilharzia regenti]|nr:unnamed protein product [Trichobilharzia regenti]